LENSNNEIDERIQKLDKEDETARIKIITTKEERGEMELRVKTKEIERGRIAVELADKRKNLRAEKAKEKSLKEANEAKRK
jgi:hypothetical protein